MNEVIVNTIHAYLWLGISWMMFCRARRVGPSARPMIGYSISAVGTASLAHAAAPFIADWAFTVRPLDLIIGGSLFALFAAFEVCWRNGPPEGVQADSKAHLTRR